MKQFKNILYLCQSLDEDDQGIARAVSLAQNNQAQLHVLDVFPAMTSMAALPKEAPRAEALVQAMMQERARRLEALVDPHRNTLEIRYESVAGTRFLEAIRTVLRNEHDLVMKVAEDPPWLERLFGSDDMHLLRKCPCPVWIMKAHDKTNYAQIVAAVDIDPDDPAADRGALNGDILEIAGSLALSDFAALHLAHAWEAPQAGFVSLWASDHDRAEREIIEGTRRSHQLGMDLLSRRLRDIVGEEAYAYLSPRIHMPMGPAHKEIPAVVEAVDADLVVMGTVARTGIAGLFIGNTAESVIDRLRCAVLAIKPHGFVTPVQLD
ncbi:universal stress protein [Algiphilus sp.]|uniref:universal stress protein n=1 Tax=Algiphilus sp. TaxID=1872431 RepID=UPI001CA66419|nr:universal stress protein [Algiphilus sp.]MBY8964935.1 universal stress protein [Algiphilus acroporae]MCI5102819.1 universal stress protein [Algiphilus sp.]MCR9091177.1 universal stress protein [Pseudomonadota bacterium]